jgi:hypothetical protein
MLPLPGSAAICASPISVLPAGTTTDQRGFARLNTSYSSSSCLDVGAVQTNYQSMQFAAASYSGTLGAAISPAPVVSVTESGLNQGGVPVTLGFSGTGTATGLGPVATVSGVGASFSNLVANSAGSDTLSASLAVTPGFALSATAGLEVTSDPQTITFTPPATALTYGAIPITLTATASSALPVTFSVISGPATLSGSTLHITGAGTIVVEASQGGNATYASAAPIQRSIQVNPAPLAIAVNSATRIYGTPNPIFTGTPGAFVNGDTAASTGLSYSTTATSTSPAGTYPITAALTNAPAAQNYSLSVTEGALTVTDASSTIQWAAPAAITYGAPLTAAQLNATVSGVPGTFVYTPAAGTVLNAGTQALSVTFTPTATTEYASATATTTLTVLPAEPVLSLAAIAAQSYGAAPFPVTATSTSNAAITYSVLSGPATIAGNLVTLTGAGTVVLQATQAASGNYAAATAQTSFTVTQPAFTLAPASSDTGATTGSGPVVPGGAATFSLILAPVGTVYPDPISLSATGLPPGATAVFTPASIPAGSPATPITLTIQTSNTQSARTESPFVGGASLPVVLSFLLLPLAGWTRARQRLQRMPRPFLMLGIIALSLGAILGLSGCGTSNGFFNQIPQTYTVKVTATDIKTSTAASTNVTLTVQ